MPHQNSWRRRLPPLVVEWIVEMLMPEMQRLTDSYPTLSLRDQWQHVEPAVATTLRRYARAYPREFSNTLPPVT